MIGQKPDSRIIPILFIWLSFAPSGNGKIDENQISGKQKQGFTCLNFGFLEKFKKSGFFKIRIF